MSNTTGNGITPAGGVQDTAARYGRQRSLHDEIFPEVRPDKRIGYGLWIAGASLASAICRVAQPGQEFPYVDWAITCRAPTLVLVVVIGAWIFVNHHRLVPIHLIVVAPIGVELDVDGVLFLGDHAAEALQRESRHHLFEIDNLKATEVVGVRPIDHEKVREPRQHCAEVRTGAIFFPKFLDAFAVPP